MLKEWQTRLGLHVQQYTLTLYMLKYGTQSTMWNNTCIGDRGPAPSISACILLTTSLSPSVTSCLKWSFPPTLVLDSSNVVDGIVETPPTTIDGGLCTNEEGLPSILVFKSAFWRSLPLEGASDVVLSLEEESFLARRLRLACGTGTGLSVESLFWGESPLGNFSLWIRKQRQTKINHKKGKCEVFSHHRLEVVEPNLYVSGFTTTKWRSTATYTLSSMAIHVQGFF